MTVQIQVPNTDIVLSGVLISVDKATLRFVARVEQCQDYIRPHTTIQATLTVGGAPRMMTAQVIGVRADTLTFKPITSAKLAERRARRRYPVSVEAQLRYNQASLPVRVVNIGIGGVGLHAPQPFEPVQIFEIEMVLVGLEQPLQVRAQVRHCRPMDTNHWYIGAAFVNLSRADELWLRKLFP